MKRLFDILFALVGLSLLAIPFVVIGLAIKLSSRGPVFYRQERIGRGGNPFLLYKFRTMYVGGGGSLVTVEGDPRITPVGRVLRRCKFDELPQLWNVLLGQMSVIGPRPEVERYVRYYDAEQRGLLDQTPGLAGLAQLVYPHEGNMLRDRPQPEEFYFRKLMPKKIAVDLEYEQTRTFLTDLRLIGNLLVLIVSGNSRHTKYDLDDVSGEDRSNVKTVGKAKELNVS